MKLSQYPIKSNYKIAIKSILRYMFILIPQPGHNKLKIKFKLIPYKKNTFWKLYLNMSLNGDDLVDLVHILIWSETVIFFSLCSNGTSYTHRVGFKSANMINRVCWESLQSKNKIKHPPQMVTNTNTQKQYNTKITTIYTA